MTKEEMEGPISFWGYKEQESNLILPEHDDDDDDDELLETSHTEDREGDGAEVHKSRVSGRHGD